jgi:hypothetical protein
MRQLIRRSLTLAMMYALVATALATVATSGEALAATGSADDRLLTTPTGWWTYNNIDANTVSAKVNEHGARITDLRVISSSPLRFTVTMVKNTGAYASGWSWYPSLTGKQVGDQLNADNGRLISAARYETASGPRYAVVMVNNSGSNFKNWYWCDCTASQLGDMLTDTNSRLTHISAYGSSPRRYVAISVANQSDDAYGWGWWLGVSAQTIKDNLHSGDRIIDLDANPDGTFNTIVYHVPGGGAWSWGVGMSAADLVEQAKQHGNRLISMSRSGNSYSGVMVDNLSGLSAQMRDRYEGQVTSGAYGFRLERDDGAVLAELQGDKKHEPASVIKVLFHLHAIRSQQADVNLTDTAPVPYRWNLTSAINGNDPGCPSDFPNTAMTTLEVADARMMIPSDNRMTVAITDYFGGVSATSPIMMDTAAAVGGMPDTTIEHCGGIGDRQTTLRDLGRVWMAAAGPKALLDATHRTLFHDRMLNEMNNGNPLCSAGIVAQEAAKLGKSSSVASGFCNAMRFMVKGGTLGDDTSRIVWTMGSLTGLPVKSRLGTTLTYYHYGAFVDGMTGGNAAINTSSNVGWSNYYEGMRQAVKAALKTW